MHISRKNCNEEPGTTKANHFPCDTEEDAIQSDDNYEVDEDVSEVESADDDILEKNTPRIQAKKIGMLNDQNIPARFKTQAERKSGPFLER